MRADADTFHFVNCTPQVGFFNTGATSGRPGRQGGRLWRDIEDYVLDNAVEEDARVLVFTGPVFRDDDPPWRENIVADFKVPMRFWKIVVWRAGNGLRATSLIADQSAYIGRMPERHLAEDYNDFSDVRDFRTSVRHIESLTGIDFGEEVRRADPYRRRRSRRGEGADAEAVDETAIEEFEELGLAEPESE